MIGAARGTVTVNGDGTGTSRRGEYFRKELALNNSSAALWQSVSVTATDGASTNQTGNTFLPQTPETFSYDADGNLTNDGRWAYVWDAENRLLSMTAPASAPSGSRKALYFAYDCRSRRISKTVSNWTGIAWVRALDEKYLYDGWNLLAVLDGTNNALLKSFVWGTDLSGTIQGAGGVGGLLALNVAGAVSLAAYDGNGNVAALVKATDGSVAAQYAYGPFGEVIRATGPLATVNPFRFSTKYQDDEADLLYYGRRHYGAAAGRWLTRDPIAERGGANLYCFVGNNAIDGVDLFGLFHVDWIEQDRKELDKRVRQIQCCGCSKAPRVNARMRGSSIGTTVTEKVWVYPSGSCKDLVTVAAYYWWDCFTAQDEYDDPNFPFPKGDPLEAWKEYGWRQGGDEESKSVTGSATSGYHDANHWNWRSAVLYIYCGPGGVFRAGVAWSDPEQFVWNDKNKTWDKDKK